MLDESGNNVIETITSEDTVVNIECKQNLSYGHKLTGWISPEVQDLSGNRLGEEYKWSFTLQNAVSILNSCLFLGAMIYTGERGLIDESWRLGGDDITARGDKVLWGYFYTDPGQVSWGSDNNPDLFVKIWFDLTEAQPRTPSKKW